jgi:thioredoxin reductase
MALMKPKRTAMSQMMKSTNGPMKGNSRLAADTLGGVLACGAVADQTGAAAGAGAEEGAVLAAVLASVPTTGEIR